MIALLAAAHAAALTPSEACSRRGVLASGVGCAALLYRTPAFAVTNNECLSCKLKDRLAEGSTRPAVGMDIGELLAPASNQNFAVKDVIDVGSDPSKFTATMRSTLSKYDPEKTKVVLWVQSELEGGVPWCPDTRAALPIFESALNRARGEVVLVVADVVRKDYYRPTYEYRTSPQLQLSGVPTLYRWGRDGPIRRLQERQITPDALDALLA